MPDYEKLENVDESKVDFNAVKADRRFINDINNDNYDQLIYEYFDDVDSYMERFPQSYNAIDYQDRDSLPNIEPDPKDSRVMFKMIDGVDPQIYIEFAKKHNKKELYMIPEKAPQKGKKHATYKDALSIIMETLYPSAHAHNNRSNTRKNSSDVFYPIGACFNSLLTDDWPSDSRRPSIRTCYFYGAWAAYMGEMHIHILRNLAQWNTSTSKSIVDCFNDENPNILMIKPVNMEVRVRARNGVSCFGPACGCTALRPERTPRSSYDKSIDVDEFCETDEWFVSRHEALHTYGYSHCEFEVDKHSSGFCNGFVRTEGACLPPNNGNLYERTHSPDRRYY